MFNKPIPIFKVYKDLNPYYDIIVSDILKQEDNVSVKDIVSNATQSITITQEAGRGSEIAIQFEYGVEPSGNDTKHPPPFPFFQTSGSNNRRIIVTCGYNNIGLTDSVEIPVVELGRNKQPINPGIITTKAKFPRPYSIFVGKLERPSINGGRDGKLTMTTFGVDSLRAFFKNPGGVVNSTTFEVEGPTNAELAEIFVRGANTRNVLTSFVKYLMTKLKKTIPEIDNYLEIRVDSSIKSLPEAANLTKLKNLLNVSGKRDILSILTIACKLFNCSYRVFYDAEKKIEVLNIITNFENSLIGVDFDGVSPGKNYAIEMKYGEAVLEFSWSGTSIGGVSINPDTIKTSASGSILTIGGVDNEGYMIEYSVSMEQVKKYVAENGGRDSIPAAIEWAKENPDAFIANFTTIPARTSDGAINRKAEFGTNGITLNLTLRYPLPGLRPGVLIYFDIAGDFPEEMFPKYLRQVYRVKKVVDTFSARENIWEQIIECTR